MHLVTCFREVISLNYKEELELLRENQSLLVMGKWLGERNGLFSSLLVVNPEEILCSVDKIA